MIFQQISTPLFPRGKIARLTLFITICLLAPFFSQCAGAQAGIALSNVPVQGRTYRVMGAAETSVYWYTFDTGVVAFPLSGAPADRVDMAVKKLLNEKNGDALVNVRYSTDRFIILFISAHRFRLKADVIKFSSGAKQP